MFCDFLKRKLIKISQSKGTQRGCCSSTIIKCQVNKRQKILQEKEAMIYAIMLKKKCVEYRLL
jgi:hypothetical protein